MADPRPELSSAAHQAADGPSYASPPAAPVGVLPVILRALVVLHLTAGGGLLLRGVMALMVPAGPLAAAAFVIVLPPALTLLLLGWGLARWARWVGTALYGLNAAGGLALWAWRYGHPLNLVGIGLEALLDQLLLPLSGPAWSRAVSAIHLAGILISLALAGALQLPRLRAAVAPAPR